jgi:hypothetical protein
MVPGPEPPCERFPGPWRPLLDARRQITKSHARRPRSAVKTLPTSGICLPAGEARIMLNKGFTSKVMNDRDPEFEALAGRQLLCPKCKKPLLNTDGKTIFTRCRSCKKWVFLKKVDLEKKV